MNNFLDFINEDIEAKKTVLSSMPLNNKTNIKKYNEKLKDAIDNYQDYHASVKKYLIAKSKSFEISNETKGNNNLIEKVENLSHIRSILNPLNTYIEKLGFDSLLFDISNYANFDFQELNQLIKKFIDKFAIAGIKLNKDDFEYTCYVNEYMTSFFEITDNNYELLSEEFEKIYWFNPEIIQHIELNFRKLIKKNAKKFNDYIEKTKRELLAQNDIMDFEDCKKKLKIAYNELEDSKDESITDIVDLAKNGDIEINNYFDNSKVRITAYSSLALETLNLDDKEMLTKFYESLKRLKINIVEYANYIKFIPLFTDFKEQYEKMLNGEDTNQLKSLEGMISTKEAKLENLNKKISGKDEGKLSFFKKKTESIKELKIESVKIAKELYELYHQYEKESFKNVAKKDISKSLLVSDVVRLYLSYDYFKKEAIKRIYNLEDYKEILKYSDDFDLFAKNPNNIIINGIYIFEENDVARNIVNKYRFENINLADSELAENDLDILLNKIDFLLRVQKIENSRLSVEKIWFMVQVNKIVLTDGN